MQLQPAFPGLRVQGPLPNPFPLALLQVPPQRQGPSQVQRLGDTQVLDITAPAWECLDEGSWATGAAAKRQHANYCAFHGNKLYTLRPGK